MGLGLRGGTIAPPCAASVAHSSFLTHSEAELQHVNGSFLLQEVHEAKEEILLLPDILQLQLQHLKTM